jgi:hypothetical protein
MLHKAVDFPSRLWRKGLVAAAVTLALLLGSLAATPPALAHYSSYCGHSPWHGEGLLNLEHIVAYRGAFTHAGRHMHNYRHYMGWFDPATGVYLTTFTHSASRACAH